MMTEMNSTPLPVTTTLVQSLNNPKRLEALRATSLLDSPPEEAFDRLTRLAGSILNTPVSLVSLVANNRQFFKSQFGLPEPWATRRETPLSHSFCQHVVTNGSPLIVADAREHPLLRQNLAIQDLQVVAYLGIPLTTPEGQILGSICAIDKKPRDWSEREVNILKELAVSAMTEIELRLLARQFQTNFLALRTLENQRDELVHMLVHDLRNPLTSMLMGLETMSLGNIPKEEQQHLGTALQGANSLLLMISEILDVSQAEAGRLQLSLAEVCPRSLIEAAGAAATALATTAGVRLQIQVAPDAPVLQADRNKLHRVLVNLISNAIQHSSAGGMVAIHAHHDPKQSNVVFEVTDHGCGLPKEACAFIFEKYGQTRLRKAGKISTGLGLPFCKMAVEAHGGRIAVESELEHGTVFRFTIPDGVCANVR